MISSLIPLDELLLASLYTYVLANLLKNGAKLTPDFTNHMRNFDDLRQAVECPKSWNSMGYVCLKATFVHLNHYLQIYLTLLWTDLWCGKWHDEYSKFSPEHLKVSKLGFWWDPLIQSYKRMSLKSTEEWCHDYEEWRKNLKRNWLAISNLTWGIW